MKSKADRRNEAEKRKEEYDKFTTEEKIGLLDSKYGVNMGAKRERSRLNKNLEKDG